MHLNQIFKFLNIVFIQEIYFVQIVLFRNGTIYEGNWVVDKIEGHGHMQFHDGSYYKVIYQRIEKTIIEGSFSVVLN